VNVSHLDGLRHRLYVLLRGEAYADEVRRELRFHRELDELAAQGNSLGNETYYREEVRAMTWQLWIDRVLQDLRYAVHGLRRAPGFTAAIVLILGLGVGVNTAMFALLDRIFVRMPEGVERPEGIRRLYLSMAVNTSTGGERYVMRGIPYPWFRAARDAAGSSIAMAGYTSPDSVLIRDGNARIPARQVLVVDDYFRALGVRAQRGRFFAANELDIAVRTPVAVLSDAFWERAYHRDPAVVGRRMKIGADQYTIIGIAAPNFTGIDLDAADLWSPGNLYDAAGSGTNLPWYQTFQSSFRVIARPDAQGDEQRLLATMQNVIRAMPLKNFVHDSTLAVLPGPIVEALGPAKRDAELTIATRVAGVSALVLVIVIANITNLMLLRALRRYREIAVRRALGVSKGRLAQQMAVEGLCIAVLGAGVAVAMSIWTQTALRRLFFPEAHWSSSPLDTRPVVFALAVSLGIGLLVGIAPAFGAFRDDLAASLKAGMKNTAYRRSRVRNALLALQAALCVVLLVGSGLFMRSLDAVRSIGTGFTGNTQFFASAVFDEPAAHRAEAIAAIPRIVEQLRLNPDVEAVGAASMTPMYGFGFGEVYIGGRDSTYRPSGKRFPTMTAVSPGFFAAAGLPLLEGRDFAAADGKDAPRVAIVSAMMAQDAWPNESPLGKCLYVGDRSAPCSVVIGVVANAHRMRLIEEAGPSFYTAVAQTDRMPATVVTVRGRPGHVAAAMRAAEAVFRSALPASVGVRTRTFDSITERELRPWRLGTTLFTALGVLALLVGAIGVYSVIAYGVSQRTHEMGIRIALGALRADILNLVLADALAVIGCGLAAGLAIALLLGKTVSSLLFGVTANDAAVLIAAGTILAVVAATACLIPGWRASRIDPVTTLRSE
jgi:predicted permease